MFVQIHQLPQLLSDIEPPLGPGPLGREHLIRFISRLPLPVRKNAQGDDAIYYGDLLRTLLEMAAPVGLNDPHTIKKLGKTWVSFSMSSLSHIVLDRTEMVFSLSASQAAS